MHIDPYSNYNTKNQDVGLPVVQPAGFFSVRPDDNVPPGSSHPGVYISKTILITVCMFCGLYMGEKDGEGIEGYSHSICEECWYKCFPEIEYPDERG